MNRSEGIAYIEKHPNDWDIIIIGGGATGLGIAVDASLRGFKILLLEQADFTKGTSSRSTKLVHGGVRYLAQGDVKLVLEALHERGLLLKNAPHLTDNQTFIIPSFSFMDGFKYTVGLKLYDYLSGNLSLGKSGYITAKQVIRSLPGINKEGLQNGIVYHDGQFDDARLGINLAQSAVENGGVVLNYLKVNALLKNEQGRIEGVKCVDLETNNEYHLHSKVVINATGIFVDDILKMDKKDSIPSVRPSQGTHIVLDRSFLPTEYALMIPKTSDGRVLFAIPWHDRLVVGTTDTLLDEESLEPKPLDSEIDFILETLNQYIYKQATKQDIKSVFSGLRPLARPSKEGKSTKEISRSHKLFANESGLITITGGKWTTYRKMAEETVDLAIKIANLNLSFCKTEDYHIHGFAKGLDKNEYLNIYGSDKEKILEIVSENYLYNNKLHPDFPFIEAEVIWAVRNEMAIHIEDFLARRIRILLLDVKVALEIAPKVAQLMAQVLGKDEYWIQNELVSFEKLASNYICN